MRLDNQQQLVLNNSISVLVGAGDFLKELSVFYIWLVITDLEAKPIVQ